MNIRAIRGGVVVALVAAGTVTGPGSPATAAGSAGFCPDASGVTVVVDFNELGGGTVVRCAQGAQATGIAALKNAGFQITGTLRWGEGFVCRIDGKPSAATEKCVDTPPTSAYWSYWYASNGGSWTYSDRGALSRKPPAGSFEGWSFSLNRDANDAPRPGVPPKRPAPPPPPASPPAPPPTGSGPVAPPDGGTGHHLQLGTDGLLRQDPGGRCRRIPRRRWSAAGNNGRGAAAGRTRHRWPGRGPANAYRRPGWLRPWWAVRCPPLPAGGQRDCRGRWRFACTCGSAW